MSEKVHLYHQVPEEMRGDVLHPLNTLKDVHPDIYASEVAKYKGREEVMEQVIPGLNAKWNDVVHLSAVHPQELHSALREAGVSDLRPFNAFEIDPEVHGMTAENTIVYIPKIGGEGIFVEFDPRKLSGYSRIPEATKEYYRRMVATGSKPLIFLGVPHIFHKGPLDVSKARRVKP